MDPRDLHDPPQQQVTKQLGVYENDVVPPVDEAYWIDNMSPGPSGFGLTLLMETLSRRIVRLTRNDDGSDCGTEGRGVEATASPTGPEYCGSRKSEDAP